MKKLLILSLISFFVFSLTAFSQVTNLKVNGSSSNFTMASGDEVSWSFDVPNPGDTTLLDFWIDANNNKILDDADVQWSYFYQIDGDSQGQNGPPDIDGTANGHVTFQQKVGLAPGNYILTFINNDSVEAVAGTVTPLNNVTFTVSGNVTVPLGYSKENIVMQLESNADGNSFWDALTDANGDFTISMDGDTTGNPWKLSISNAFIFKASTVDPQNYRITLDSSSSKQYANNDFTITAAAASISGVVKDGNNDPVVNTYVYVSNYDNSLETDVSTDFQGKYYLGLSSNVLPQSDLNVGLWADSSFMQFNFYFPSIKAGDNLTQNMYLLKANSVISGRVSLDGNNPGMLEMIASTKDTGFIRTYTSNEGYFEFKVSNKINNYTITAGFLPMGYVSDSLVVHPGDTNVNMNLTMTGVEQTNSNVPKKFSLSQNYPNPFNPSTMISYELPRAGMVTLKVFNILGQEVKVLVNKFESAGKYNVQFNASELESGVYFYQFKEGNHLSTRKMILLK